MLSIVLISPPLGSGGRLAIGARGRRVDPGYAAAGRPPPAAGHSVRAGRVHCDAGASRGCRPLDL